ncbi:G2/M phase-specific E3 ubiquitin-protein ligase-like [Xyrichtys novacula]|uniref:HECT-type E3 ubiquitin transferase n=1 Tax=Xyrichtys novacula TaxID=13765 RepID=A0AAV1GRR6_XYRNO|nr:G2/M phase-specific E3 ubiquitin-protein ligase-like [Xyrichtys novacula]
MYCRYCGKELPGKPNFCSSCGKRLQEADGDSPSTSQTIQSPTLQTFLEYRKKKAEERQKFSCGKKAAKKPEKINVGLVSMVKGGGLKPLRGRSLCLSTHPDITAPDLLDQAVKKMKDFNKDLDDGPFILLYPDCSEVVNVPGTETPFMLKTYKEEIGKPYQRITIYICSKTDFEEVGKLSATCDTDSDPEIVIKRNTTLDLADTLPFEPYNMSSPVHNEPEDLNSARGLSLSSDLPQTIVLDNDHDYASPSGCHDVKSSCYRTYTDLFGPIIIDDDDEDEVPIPDKTHDMASEEFEPTSVQAAEVIANLALAIDHKKVSRFNISRSDVWDGAVRGFRRSTYSESSDIFVKFTDDAGSFEEGLDTGGPKREFLTLLMTHLRNRPIFDGPPERRYLVYNSTAVREDEYFLAGKMIVVSIIHGGPAPHFLSKDLVNHLLGKTTFNATVEDVTDEELRKALRQVQEAESDESLQDVILQYSTMFQTAGCLRRTKVHERHMLIEDYLRWYILGRNQIAIQRFKEGLASLQFLTALQQHSGVLAPILCHSSKALTASEMESLFRPDRSPRGSNRWQKENQTIGFWADFLLDCEEKVAAVSLEDVLMFASGLAALPPAGMTPSPSIEFLIDSPFPMACTCTNTLKLPLLDTYRVFKTNMEFGIQNAPGFGCF